MPDPIGKSSQSAGGSEARSEGQKVINRGWRTDRVWTINSQCNPPPAGRLALLDDGWTLDRRPRLERVAVEDLALGEGVAEPDVA